MGQKFRHSVRFKLMLAALTLLVIPWAGYRYLEETESFLRDAQDQNLANSARALALLVQSRVELIPELTAPTPDYPDPNLYVHSLPAAPSMDGFADEWDSLAGQFQEFTGQNDMHFSVALAEHDYYLYLMLKVTDRQVRYRQNNQQALFDTDSVQLRFRTRTNMLRDFLLLPEAPGALTARSLQMTREGLAMGPADNRIKGNWQETADGYSLELRIPSRMTGKQLGLQINNYSDGQTSQSSTSHFNLPGKLGTLVYPVPELTSLLQQAAHKAERRRVLSTQGYVLGRDGNLDSNIENASNLPWLMNKLTSLALRHQAKEQDVFEDNTNLFENNQHRILESPVSTALQGKPTLSRYRPPGKDNLVLAASHPVYAYSQPVGTVLVEQTTEALLSIQNQALQRLLSITLILFLLVALVLLGFASMLTARIRKLHRQVDEAVTADGRIVGNINPGTSSDEIGELGRGFSSVLGRLSDYNHYLEAMASRLTHELRTPLTIVRTSLDSCQQMSEEQTLLPYLTRAQQGTDRLESIIKRLREATRLEKILADVELESVDLGELLQSMVTSFKAIYPDVDFEISQSQTDHIINGAPDLIYQAMEKIIANAVDFHRPDTTILIKLGEDSEHARVCVENLGPDLPENIDPFQSMVSVREKAGTEPHLGLGLYLVRLIAEFHGGKATAKSLEGNAGVCVCISLSRHQSLMG